MKSIVPIELALLSLILISTCPSPAPSVSSRSEAFVATSPCNESSRRWLQIPASAGCEMIKWDLTLHQDTNTLTPTTYTLNCVYGLPQQGTLGLSNGGTRVAKQGKWTTAQGAKANPQAVVYKLDSSDSQQSLSFQKVNNNLLHLLDPDESLALGTAGWSYTLNRTETPATDLQPASAFTTPGQLSSPNTRASSTGAASSILGRFVGRSPCREVARDLNKTVNSDCIKVKWDLILYQDRATLQPTTYKLNGTFYRERVREGKWAFLQGAKTDAAAVVYQLDPDKPEGSLLFLKADDNILFFLDRNRNLMVGNKDFSYTLNRTK
jgi:hypothetical protein